MILLPISTTEIRAMHGVDAAMPVLALLAASGMGLSLEHLETGTGYKRHALVKACRLLQHMRLADYEEPRPNTLRNIRLIAAVQLPLPGTHTYTHIPAGPESQPTGEQAVIQQADVTRFRLPEPAAQSRLCAPRESETRESENRNLAPVVVDGVNKQSLILDSQQHQQQKQAADSHERFRVRGILRAIGMWPNVIADVEDSDLADVLGWVAYISDPNNKIGNRPALVAANLKAARPSGRAYRPFRICRKCSRIETVCECEEPDLHMPEAYDMLAIKPPAPGWGESVSDWLQKRWYCQACFSYPCQCAVESGSKDDQE